MAMRARVFDDWTGRQITDAPDAVVIHIGCGLDSRCLRVTQDYRLWIDCDLPDVLTVRRQYYQEDSRYRMMELDATDTGRINELPDSGSAIIVMEGLSMYLTNVQLNMLLTALHRKYRSIHILMDVYTVFGAKATKFKNPVNDVGVSEVYGVDDIDTVLTGSGLRMTAEHSFTPPDLVDELDPSDRRIFKMLFTGKTYRKIVNGKPSVPCNNIAERSARRFAFRI